MAAKRITAKEAADQVGMSARYIARLCADGRIKGAEKFGMTWVLPANFKWQKLPRGPRPKPPK